MGHRLRRLAVLLLGAMLLGTVGLSLGSWYGGRGVTPPTDERARDVAAELLPNASPHRSNRVVRGSRWDVRLAADDFGSGRVRFWYDDDDCELSGQLRQNAETHGWHDVRQVPGYLCDGWRAEKDGLTVTLTRPLSGTELTVAPSAPNTFVAVTIAGALIGATAGAALFWLALRQRPPVPLVVVSLVTVGLLPGVAFTWSALAPRGLAEPLWPIWPALTPLLAPLWIVLMSLGAYALLTLRSPHNRAVAVVTVAWALVPVGMLAALLLLFLRAQPERAASALASTGVTAPACDCRRGP
ncbi:hypothetical protein ACFY2Q_02845 [Micromonospora sp. NPDC000316]|uniref:hypothetical protein n=1 Tax=Micromonospora sp. NPDC000316 TaxID=3364216 RepID=UPI003693F785